MPATHRFVLRLGIALLFLLGEAGALLWAESSVWKVVGPHATVYLAGSFHLLKPTDYPLPQEFEEAYAPSAKVYFEVLLDEMAKPDIAAEVFQHAVYPEGGLKDHLTAQTYAQLEDYCRSQNIDVKALDRYRPWMVGTVLAMAQMKKAGFDPDLGVDRYFTSRAEQDKKVLVGLETIQEQISWLAADTQLDEAQITQMLEELSEADATSTAMANAWRVGDMDTLGRSMDDQMKGSPELKKLLLTDRNRRWIRVIESELAGTEDVLFVVGAGHFAGDEGLLALLRKDGYLVENL